MKKLLVINYAMDENDPIFSHQAEAVNEISKYFSEVHVLTSHTGTYPPKENVRVVSTAWQRGSNIRNLIQFYKSYHRLMRQVEIDIIFCHMTDVQSALIAIHARVFRKPHYLWYAHKSKSIFLSFTQLFVTGLITSTSGSLPISNSKVHIIGQAINPEKFKFKVRQKFEFRKFVHFGRLDHSKRIADIVKCLERERHHNPDIRLTLFGNPTGSSSESYIQKILSTAQINDNDAWIEINPSVPRNSIGELLSNYDVFIHGYLGSLDKSILEATFVGIPVVTANPEFLAIFGSWNQRGFSSLEEEVESLRTLSESKLRYYLEKRRLTAEANHSLDSWSFRVAQILNSYAQ